MTEQEYADKIDALKEQGKISEAQWNDLDTVGECLFTDKGKITPRNLTALKAALDAAVGGSAKGAA